MTEKELIEKLRKQYSENPPEGMTRQDVLHMSDNDLLDMDYFLTEEDEDGFGEEGWLFWHRCGSITSNFPYAD